MSALLECINDALQEELPFTMKGLGKFYYKYANNKQHMKRKNIKGYPITESGFYSDKVVKTLCFEVSDLAGQTHNGWVQDLGMKNNVDKEALLKLAISPDEISKLRRKKKNGDELELLSEDDIAAIEEAGP